jgi:tRNA A-37 threonylcarbamoyl transferase component Bud32/tetratricopeptide (TPR) repeat protein
MTAIQNTQQLEGAMAAPSKPSALAVPTLADFQQLRELGRGGNAVVYEALWTTTGQRVALKIIHGELLLDPKFLVRFRREVRAASQLDHPHICRVYAFGEEDKSLWLAMELLDGGSVRDLIDRAGRLPPQVAALLTTQWLSALGAAHAVGILHRDVKPANAMVTSDGQLKLVDFGIAKAADDATVTETGFLVGTPAYMSPEQAVGQPVDERMDLYAVGVSLYEMLAGENPYANDSPQAALLRIASQPLPSLFEQDPTVPGAVEAVLEHLTERHPDDRVRHASDAVVELRPYCDYVEDVHPGLLKAFVADPVGVAHMLNQERAELERARAEQLLLGGDANLQAAALALYRASLLAPNADVKERLQVVCGRASLHFGIEDDDELRKAKEVHAANPGQAGPVKRVADLYRARGDIHRFVVYIRRYLRLRPNDSHARQQLEVAVGGVATPELGPDQRLRTHDILAGIQTGGWAAAPDARKAAALKLQQPSCSVAAARAPTVNPNGATTIVRTANHTAAPTTTAAPKDRIRVVAASRPTSPTASSETFGDVVAEVWAGWGRRLLVLALVFGAFGLMLRLTSKSVEVAVDATQVALSDNVAAVGAIEQNDIARRQQNLHQDAVGHFNAGDHLKVIVDVNNLLALKPPADLALGGILLRARSRAALRQFDAARRDYEEFIRQTPLSDGRRMAAVEELNAMVQR